MRSHTISARSGICGHRHGGLTLIEMLVTLAIVSALVALLTQAMSQIYRIERVMDSGQLGAQARALRLEQLRIAVETALPVSRNSPEAFSGDSSSVSFLSSELPTTGLSGLGMVKLALQFDEGTQQMQLRAQLQKAGSSQASWVAQTWPGRSGRMLYYDHLGNPHDTWPSVPTDSGTLPAAIVVDPGVVGADVLIARPGASPKALRSKRELVTE